MRPKGSFKSAAYGIEAAEYSYAEDVLKGNFEEIVFTYTDRVESLVQMEKIKL